MILYKLLFKIVDKYNNTYHSGKKMTPREVSIKENESIAYLNLYHSRTPRELEKPQSI